MEAVVLLRRDRRLGAGRFAAGELPAVGLVSGAGLSPLT
jgi:hypothetical protein